MQMLRGAEFEESARHIRLLVLDVDGVLTDGSVIYDERGGEIKAFHVRDGYALRQWILSGRRVAVITGRSSAALARRCRELGLCPIIQGATRKEADLHRLIESGGYQRAEVCCVGDDLPDAPMFSLAGMGIAVADADPSLREMASYVTEQPGGRGAVREVIESLMRAQGQWPGAADSPRRIEESASI